MNRKVMTVIEALPIERAAIETAAIEQIVRVVANIESMVQLEDAWDYQALVELLKQDSINMLVAYEKEKENGSAGRNVVGYCLYQITFEQAEILRIGTNPDYQRQGIASKILSELHELLQCKQVESLLLEVRADNNAAIALYEQQEFAVIHKRKGYYKMPHQPAVDALIMQRIYT